MASMRILVANLEPVGTQGLHQRSFSNAPPLISPLCRHAANAGGNAGDLMMAFVGYDARIGREWCGCIGAASLRGAERDRSQDSSHGCPDLSVLEAAVGPGHKVLNDAQNSKRPGCHHESYKDQARWKFANGNKCLIDSRPKRSP